MCGIAGGVSLRAGVLPELERVRSMTRALAHRGPDGDGFWTAPSGKAILGHRRLAIIDLATGDQPMVAPEGSRALIFNGEIYNYIELRRELAAPRGGWRTQSDSEVLLEALAQWGPRGVERTVGQFAIAHWDDRTATLLLARDRLGKKPLYFFEEDGVLYFASSIPALRTGASRPWTVDLEALGLFLTLGYLPAPHTGYREVTKLGAASLWSLSTEARSCTTFWDPGLVERDFAGSADDAEAELHGVLRDAVRIRLRSDVPQGIFLSGGIDSSLVTAIAVEESPSTVQTFSIGFGETDYDESTHAASIAEHLGTSHHPLHGSPELLDLIPEVARHFGEPFGDSSVLNVWSLSQATRRHVTVALGGDGGDEGFAGYPWYRTALTAFRVGRAIPGPLLRAGDSLVPEAPRAGHVFGRARRALGHLAQPGDGWRYASLRSHLGLAEARELFGPALAPGLVEGTLPGHRLLAERYRDARGPALRRIRAVDISTYLADGLMPKVDVGAMAHALEVRAPLLDHRVVELGLSLPEPLLWRNGESKRPLRDLLRRRVPARLFERPKMGFRVPLAPWFRAGGGGALEALLGDSALLDGGVISRDGVARLIADHREGTRDRSQLLFSLLMLERWLAAA